MKKKQGDASPPKRRVGKLKTLFLAAAALFSSATLTEAAGYGFLDGEGGRNILCDIDLSCRYMTEGEIEEARKIYGDQIDYDAVKIFDRRNYVTSWFRATSGGQAPNGNIYYDNAYMDDDDFSDDPLKLPSMLHELGHVWQQQSGRNMLYEALKEWFRNEFDYDGAYDYDLEDGTPFSELGIEQQAEIINDYKYLLNQYQRNYTWASWRTKNCQDVRKFESKISEELPVETFAPCRVPDLG